MCAYVDRLTSLNTRMGTFRNDSNRGARNSVIDQFRESVRSGEFTRGLVGQDLIRMLNLLGQIQHEFNQGRFSSAAQLVTNEMELL